MYPIINISTWISVYTFGICMIIAWGIFFTLLHYFSIQRGISKHIFGSIIDFTLAIFFFGRLFYILAEWRSERFLFVDLFEKWNLIQFLKEFFITDNYSISFAGGVIGFIIVFIWKTWNNTKDRPKYWDSIVPAFLIAASVWYLWTLFGWQIYGIVMDTFFSITYRGTNSSVPFQNPTFPLPIFYTLFSLLTVFFLYRIDTKMILPEWFIGYMGMGIFSIVLFLGEFLNGASDLFSSRIYLNITQIIALGLISYAMVWLLRIIKY